MKQARKIYDAAFKIKAVELSNERSNITELARELGICISKSQKQNNEAHL
jgi:transposase